MAAGWRKFKTETVLKAIENSAGVKLLICKRLKCDRATFERYLNDDKAIRQAYEAEIENLGDLCESQLIEQIKSGNIVATIFFCKTKLKHRGYVERQEVDTTQPIVFKIDKDDANA